jgi:hypothetical protein
LDGFSFGKPLAFIEGEPKIGAGGECDETAETPETPETPETAGTVFFLLRELSFTNWFITCANSASRTNQNIK